MDIDRVRSLLGTNIWADFPVAEVWLDLTAVTDAEIDPLIRRVRARLRAEIPTCRLPQLTAGLDRGGQELWLARAFAHLILTLGNHLGGTADAFLRVVHSGQPGLVQIAFPYHEALAPRACAQTALALFQAIRAETGIDLPAVLSGLAAAAAEVRPSPTLAALTAAAGRRDIPVRHLGSGLLQLGYGARQVRTQGTRSERLGAVAQWVTGERDLMKELLACIGIACTPAAVGGRHYRLLVAGGKVVASVLWQPGQGAGPAAVTDVSELVHPEVRARAVDAARALGLDVAEVRLVVADLTRPLEGQGGQVSEVIAAPALDAYLERCDSARRRRRLARYPVPPGGGKGRIPIVAVSRHQRQDHRDPAAGPRARACPAASSA